jgi:hypothetical protein
VELPQTAKQQLKADIAALADRLDCCSDACNSTICSDIINKLRQLSAV